MNSQGEAEYEFDGKATGDEKSYRESMAARNSAAVSHHSAAKQSLL